MKKIIILSILILLSYVSMAQLFAPVGATWYYTSPGFSPPNYEYPFKLESVKDTMISGIQCRKIIGSNYNWGLNANFVYSDSSKVYIYDRFLQHFVKIYDFNLMPGDTLKYSLSDYNSFIDTCSYVIDSIGTRTINGKSMKVQFTHNLVKFVPSYSRFIMGGKIIAGIGSDFFLFPQSILLDPPINKLRCYNDTILGNYNTGIVSKCDTVVLSVKEEINFQLIKVYPNPVNTFLRVENPYHCQIQFKLYSITGKLLFNSKYKENTTSIDMSLYEKGIYLAEIILPDRRKTTKKIIRN